ncbi:RecF/RecN/SMC N terminal domain-containing protein [Cardiosporidium cionae]|uniref:RecF/RecN/SMC N terminal domain-containing protein n=1 Tax=Cardiosporidium cionae TaxID=476202 RepID=A0ABQ7JDZ5_9APIC|nr:RecF/RecN/SMC N terminal domain-containing protein [Cardiosporidium cionae]|eukprot:KAF8822184.1 RecF/RecN/SMC N terminal domain-containing protein [Cardiosporidium cionae]
MTSSSTFSSMEDIASLNLQLKEIINKENKVRNLKEDFYSQLHKKEIENERLKAAHTEATRNVHQNKEKKDKIISLEEEKMKQMAVLHSHEETLSKNLSEQAKVLADRKHKKEEMETCAEKSKEFRLHFSQYIHRLKEIHEEIFKTENSLSKLAISSEEDDTVQEDKELCSKALRENRKKKMETQEILLQNQQLEITLKKNLELKRKEFEIQKLHEAVATIKTKIGNMDFEDLKRKLKEATHQTTQIQLKIALVEGALSNRSEVISQLKTSLSSSLFNNIDKIYETNLVAAEASAIATKDLSKYHTALDKALMKYHSMKMEEINQSIKDLWQTIYTGQDIDSIAVRSDADNDVDFVSSYGQRSYNYRIVMIKNGVELEMRGRCSAGQKVLASLIIRLALAESFCVNCGILALDEPTTNLDQYNIENFAKALASLIEMRKDNSNFQLILITHDEDFVFQLAKHSMCDNYYKVEKDSKGDSIIQQADIRKRNFSFYIYISKCNVLLLFFGNANVYKTLRRKSMRRRME